MTTKSYEIYCIRKANRNAYVHRFTVFASNVKEAKEKAGKLLYEKLGSNAFTLTNGKLPKSFDWDAVAKINGTTIDAIMDAALAPQGYAIYA